MHHHCQLLIDLSARLSLLVTHLDQPSKNPPVNPTKQGGQDKAPVKGKSVIKQHANYLKNTQIKKNCKQIDKRRKIEVARFFGKYRNLELACFINLLITICVICVFYNLSLQSAISFVFVDYM